MADLQETKKIDWLYAGAHAHVDREEYLLGRSIDSSFHRMQEDDDKKCYTKDETLVNIPGALFEEKAQADKLDLEAKNREDPLMAIKRKADERRKALLSNPYEMKQLLKKQKNAEVAPSISSKSHDTSKTHNKINARSKVSNIVTSLKEIGVDKLSSLLNADSSSSSSSESDNDEKISTSSSRKRRHGDDRKSNDYQSKRVFSNDRRSSRGKSFEKPSYRKDDSRSDRSTIRTYPSSSRDNKPRQSNEYRSQPNRSSNVHAKQQQGHNNSTESMEKKLEEMRQNASWRAALNTQRLGDAEKRHAVQQQRDTLKPAEGKGFVQNMLVAAAGASSVGDRIRSNLHSVQRTKHAQEESFVRR